ncbi:MULTISPECIES: helix-turn-helix domain-containing protein [Betaproteobacteria]|nr:MULTISPECIES: helix-turn-helix domain-containing protein [Betaproteobacteria]
MSIKAMNWAWEQRLPPNSKLILMALADAADEVGQCWPRVRLIAEKCCTSERTVQRVLKELEAAGFLHIERNYRKDGGQSSNVYSLSLAPPSDKSSPPSDRLAPGGGTGDTPGVTQLCHPPGDRAMSPHEPPHRTINESSQPLPAKVIHTPPPSPMPGEAEKGACGALVWPSRVEPGERLVMSRMLAGIDGSDAQMLLDELAGVMATRSLKTTPERWFRAIVARYRQGHFAPSAGLAVKEKRLRSQSAPIEPPTRAASPETIRHHMARIGAILGRRENAIG